MDQARVAVERVEIEESRQIAGVVADVLKAYWDLVSSRRMVEIQKIDRRLADEQRVVTQARIAAGELANVELWIDETVASRQAEVLEPQRAAAEAEARLKTLMGVRRDDLYLATLRPEDGFEALPAGIPGLEDATGKPRSSARTSGSREPKDRPAQRQT